MWLKGVKQIYALEPNLEAFNALKDNLKGIKKISTLNIAVSSETKKENLYLDENIQDKSSKDKILSLSQASSLLPDKTNIGDQYYEVQAKFLIDLLSELGKSPTIIKCDIERGEYIIYKQFIELASSLKIRKIFVECNAERYPQYKKPHEDFMNLIKQNNLETIIDTSWHKKSYLLIFYRNKS